jgi:addiction module HigA family antidote
MAIKNTTKRQVPPTHPGEMLREDFMPDFDLSATSMARALGVSRQTVNELLRERRAITSIMALGFLFLCYAIFGVCPQLIEKRTAEPSPTARW